MVGKVTVGQATQRPSVLYFTGLTVYRLKA